MKLYWLFSLLVLNFNLYSQKSDSIKNKFNCKDIYFSIDDFEYIDVNTGTIYNCGLFIEDESYFVEYDCFENDSTVLLYKLTNKVDSSFSIGYFKQNRTKTYSDKIVKCWEQYYTKSDYTKLGVLIKTEFLYTDEPKKIGVYLKD